MIFPHTCYNCGHTTEPLLFQVGSVVNVCCDNCRAHIRYCHLDELPTKKEVKTATYQVAHCSLPIIDEAKKRCLKPYWSLYLFLIWATQRARQKSEQ